MLDSISRHNSKTLHVFIIFEFDLEPAQIIKKIARELELVLER